MGAVHGFRRCRKSPGYNYVGVTLSLQRHLAHRFSPISFLVVPCRTAPGPTGRSSSRSPFATLRAIDPWHRCRLLQGAAGAWCPPRDVQPSARGARSEEHTSELQSRGHLVCRLLLEKKTQDREETTRRPTM